MTEIDWANLPGTRATAINQARAETYGTPVTVFPRTAKIWSGILGIDVSEEQVAACMAGLKLAREAQADYRRDYDDNVDDVCGYMNCLEIIKKART